MQFVKSIHIWGKWKIIFLLLVLFNKVRNVIASIFNIGQIKMQVVLYKRNSIGKYLAPFKDYKVKTNIQTQKWLR